MITIVARPTGHQNGHAEAMAAGLRALGIEHQRQLHTSPRVSPGGTVVCWSWRLGKVYYQTGSRVLVMERGYIGDRFAWTSLGWNGLNGRAQFPEVPDDGGERFRAHHGELLKPWQSGGDYVLIIGQVPGDAALNGKDLYPWYCEQAKRAAAHYGLPVRFRPHPLANRGGHPVRDVPGAPRLEGFLHEALNKAAVVVTFNSNTAVESVLAGRPTIAMDPGSMAWEVTSHSIEDPNITPAREDWARRLAWKQWRIDEIRDGTALAHVFSVNSQRSAA